MTHRTSPARWSTKIMFLAAICAGSAARAEQPDCLGWIAVESEPVRQAEIRLDDKLRSETTPATLKKVPCGRHDLQVGKTGYTSASMSVEVKQGEVAKVRLQLRSNQGSISVRTVPPGAEVLVDGVKQTGETPVELDGIAAGVHKVQVSLPDHEPETTSVAVFIGKQAKVSHILKPLFGRLEVIARPEDGVVWLDGDSLGPAPLTLQRVSTGDHAIRVTADMHHPYEKHVRIRAGQLVRLKAILTPDFGTLKVLSEPKGAKVIVDDKPMGATPLSLRLAPGVHGVQLVGEGALGKVARQVRILRGGYQTLQVKIPHRTGQLLIDTVPFAAFLEVDGRKRGTAPLSLKKVPVGRHALTARAKGLPPLVGSIDVVEGQTSTVEMNLKEPLKSFYRTPQANQAVDQRAGVSPPPTAAKTSSPVAVAPRPAEEVTGSAEKTAVSASAPPSRPSEAVQPAREQQEVVTDVSAEAVAPMSGRRLSAWILGGTAVATTIASVTLFGVGLATQSDADDAYETWRTSPNKTQEMEDKYMDLDRDAAALYTAGWICAGVAVAGWASSVYLYLTEPEPEVDRSGPHAIWQFNPLPGGGWVGLIGRF